MENTLEEREADLGTSPRVVRLIPRRAGSISSLYGAKTNSKAKKKSGGNLKKQKSRIKNGLSTSIEGEFPYPHMGVRIFFPHRYVTLNN